MLIIQCYSHKPVMMLNFLQILGRMKKRSRKRVLIQLKKIVNGYIQCSSVLSEYLGVADMTTSIDEVKENKRILNTITVEIFDEIHENTDELEVSSSESDDDVSESNSEKSENDEVLKENDSESRHDFTNHTGELSCDSMDIPIWLFDYARKGKIQSCVIDIINLRQYFFPPQVEDHSLSSSHHTSLKLLSAIVGLLLGKSDSLVKYWTRNGARLDWYTVDPIYECDSLIFPPCSEVLTLCDSKRLCALLEVAEVSINIKIFPSEWQLFIVAILFWLRNMKQPAVTESHLHTMVMCLVALYTIDSKIGVHRNKPTFTKKYKSYISKLVESRSKEKKSSKVSSSNTQTSSFNIQNCEIDVKEALTEVTHDDCVLMFEAILPYHHLSEQIKSKPKQFCLVTVHAFAQFQSCLFHLMVFNSILGFPLLEPSVSRLYSGTFAYNMFVNLSKRNNISAYVETFFQAAPSLLKLYRAVVVLLKASISDVDLYIRHAKKGTKRRKKPKEFDSDQSKTLKIDNEKEEVFFDENNIFSSLSLNF